MSAVTAPFDSLTRTRRQDRKAERRRLKKQDRLSAQLGELHAMSDLLERATEVVGRGWIQGAWFTVATSRGPRAVTAYDLPVLNHRPVVGACLVGSVVEAAGGPAAVRSQLVQRTLDAVGHTLREDASKPVQWCPGPRVRVLGVLELTHWNDAPGRTQAEVVGLLEASKATVERQRQRCLEDQAALTPVG
jgi:hypothetical protein